MPCPPAARPPYGAYALLLITFTTLLICALWFLGQGRVFGWIEFVLLAVATHEVTNLVATDRVTSVLRRPFVSERQFRSRHEGLRLRHTAVRRVTK